MKPKIESMLKVFAVLFVFSWAFPVGVLWRFIEIGFDGGRAYIDSFKKGY
jgi:hypothetical protein